MSLIVGSASPRPESPREKKWAAIGKVLATGTAIIGVGIAYWQATLAHSNQPSLDVTAEKCGFVLPVEFSRLIEKARTATREIQELSLKVPEKQAAVDRVTNELKTTTGTELFALSYSLRSLCKLTIHNRGGRPATNVTITAPSIQFAEASDGTEKLLEQRGEKFRVADLPADEIVVVHLWSTGVISDEDYRAIKVTHNDGTSRPSFPSPLKTFLWLFIPVYLLSIAIIAWGIWFWMKRRKPMTNAE